MRNIFEEKILKKNLICTIGWAYALTSFTQEPVLMNEYEPFAKGSIDHFVLEKIKFVI